ncbi:AraC family transcriptional regulator [Pleomorphomonas sp. JP5]|uniref:helix-turn-helix transcriptional regulator n=1 Tax=Pleomorphomonas sp. JP5 TaxID=2942998 RepID=UPI0020440872|nr:helix-turn-helix domain-containing protein [Pleomorphomonas sp. JP5]MCM5557488.1 helix-turn-helix domain-containing protein [Pleomorphomonas sp. JP5]
MNDLLSLIYDAPVHLKALNDDDFLFRTSNYGDQAFLLCDSYTSGVRSSFDSDNDDIVIKIRSRGGYEIRTRSDEYHLSHDIGFAYTASHAIGYSTAQATAISTIQIKRSVFDQTLEQYSENIPHRWSGIREFPIGGGFGNLIQALMNRYRENFDGRPHCTFSETSLQLIQDAAIVAIAELVTGGLDAARGERVSASHRNVMQAVDMINCQTTPLTIHDLAAALGISVRALQDGFRRHLNQSPHNLLKAGRLEGARRDLISGKVTSVREAATKWGFSNLARFNQEYRAVIGKYPKETLDILHDGGKT